MRLDLSSTRRSSGDRDLAFGGKFTLKLDVDGAKLGLWSGFSANLIGEYQWGANVDGYGGTLLPVNTALTFPQDGGSGGDISLVFTQRFAEGPDWTPQFTRAAVCGIFEDKRHTVW
jgi:porin